MDGMQQVERITADTALRERFLALGKPETAEPEHWTDYAQAFGLGEGHISVLLDLAGDTTLNCAETETPAVWAPVHAWRALGQLRAEAAIPALVHLIATLDDDMAADADLPVVLGMIGPAAIDPLAAMLANAEASTDGSLNALTALSDIGVRHPESRARCVAVLTRCLEPEGASTVEAGFAVGCLIDLHAVESIETIRDAFRRDAVDSSIAGDLEDVEIAMGLRAYRDTPQPRYVTLPTAPRPDARATIWPAASPIHVEKVGRNQPCPCGSGRKYKKCCL